MAAPIGLEDHIARLDEARHHDPFEILGRHRAGDREVVRAYLPGATEARIEDADLPMVRYGEPGRTWPQDIGGWRTWTWKSSSTA